METEEAKETVEETPKEETRKTRLDWFLADILDTEIEVTPELWDSMLRHATEYIAAGGKTPEYERWAMLGAASRAAFAEARASLKIRSALEGGA